MRNNVTAGLEDLGHETDYQDTVALLQEEIAHLEEEIRVRDEARADRPAEAAQPSYPAPDPAVAGRIEELTGELARREETIALLLDELGMVDEAAAAGRAEWEQLNLWVEEVEQRVESRTKDESNLQQELVAERRKAELKGRTLENEQRAWDSQRRVLEGEVERLRDKLSTVAKQSDSNADLALAALEGENKRLRRTCDELSRTAAAAAEVGRLRELLDTVRSKLDDAETRVRGLEDDIVRERKEHEAALATLRSQTARELVPRRDGQGEIVPAAPRDLSLVTADERVAAFRQHLQDVHKRELDERASKRLSARLSRLWKHTGPA